MNRRKTIFALIALGGAVCPLGALAQQQGRIWRVGFLLLGTASESERVTDAFLQGMRDLGYTERRNLLVEWRFADDDFKRLAPMAADLVRLKVDVILAQGSPAISAVQHATSSIPIVMATTGDPVGSGFVKSLARPGGNITGLSNMGGETGPKLLDLIHSVVPTLSRVAVLVSPTSTTYRVILESLRSAAANAHVNTLVREASTPQEIDDAFFAMAHEKVDAAVVTPAPFFTLQQRQIADLAIKYRIPSVCGNRAIAEAGLLMSYGQNYVQGYLRSARFVDKIFKGAKPGDLPVEQATQFELVVNLKTAKILGLAVPESILLRADGVLD
jgi:putative ABC transport system substrate-binding protein